MNTNGNNNLGVGPDRPVMRDRPARQCNAGRPLSGEASRVTRQLAARTDRPCPCLQACYPVRQALLWRASVRQSMSAKYIVPAITSMEWRLGWGEKRENERKIVGVVCVCVCVSLCVCV